MSEPLAISVRRAMELSTLGETTIYKLIKQGKLRTTLVLGRRLIDYASFMELLIPTSVPTNLSRAPAKGDEGPRREATGKRPKIKGNSARSARLRRYAKGS